MEYGEGMGEGSFKAYKERFEAGLGAMVGFISEMTGLQPRLFAMHHFVVGGDDRVFNRGFARRYLTGLSAVVCQMPMGVSDILSSMQDARLCICMRFHSVLFAQESGIPFIAVDYTRGGKIAAYLDEKGALHKMISAVEIADGTWKKRVVEFLETGVP